MWGCWFISNYGTESEYLSQKKEEAGSLSKSERQKLQRLYMQGAVAHGSERKWKKASNLQV